jgi:Uma2 family endonuclease
MTLAATPAPSRAPFDARTPLRLPEDLRLTPEQFELVCAANPEAVLELDAEGRLIVITPTGSESGARNEELLYQLQQFA